MIDLKKVKNVSIVLAAIPLLANATMPVDKMTCKSAVLAAEWCAREPVSVSYDFERNVMCVNGLIDPGGKLSSQVSSLHPKTNVSVVVNSDGGSVADAIDIVNFLRKYRYSIIVNSRCLSSCAQFLFLGSNQRLILGKAMVAMHGYPFSHKEIRNLKLIPKYYQSISRANDRFREFFSSRRIPLHILSGRSGDTGSDITIGATPMWVPSIRDYASYGIDVISCD